MNVVLDEDLHRSLRTALKRLGHEVFDIRDYGLRGKSDKEIFEFAQQQKAVLFSGDLGFANIIEFPLGSHFGIAILRFPNEMPTNSINQAVRSLMGKISKEDFEGNLIIFSPMRIRIRRQ
jgi:predicted nuclease of predicted toxin-antitoxin system